MNSSLNKNSKNREISKIILDVIKERRPQSIRHLTGILKEDYHLHDKEILNSILKLKAEGRILFESQIKNFHNFKTYLKTGNAIGYWITIVLLTMAVLVFIISDNVFPWILIKNLLSLLFILFLPGYVFTKAIFPIKNPVKSINNKLEEIEKIALSIGLSIALVSIAGLLLYYSPWGLDNTTIVLFLVVFTSIFSTAALIKEYRTKRITN